MTTVPGPRRPWIEEWLFHHLGAIVATAADFAVMILLVEVFRFSPVGATAIGATVGGTTNYWFGRRFTYRAGPRASTTRPLRYVLVSATSLLLNTFGEFLVVTYSGAHYLPGRLAITVAVSTAWNYPLQKYFVFTEPSPAEDAR